MSEQITKELKQLRKKERAQFTEEMILKNANVLLLEAHSRDQEVLSTLGLDHIEKYERDQVADVVRTQKQQEIYSRDVFTGEQARFLCRKFNLRILPTSMFNGSITSELARVIDEFCQANDLKLEDEKGNFFMMAPVESFHTIKNVPIAVVKQRMELDPILFYRPLDRGTTNRDTFNKVSPKDTLVQVYNWGNDFKWHRPFSYLFNGLKEREDDPSTRGITVVALVLLLAAIVLGITVSSLWVSAIPFSVAATILMVNAGRTDHMSDEQWNTNLI